MSDKNQLPIPDAAVEDPKSIELLRVWVANQRQHVSLKSGVWDDPVAWGIMLADLAKHIANSFQQDVGLDRSKCLLRIKAGLDAEFAAATDEPSGWIQS